MPITPFLNGVRFDPETKRVLGIALEMACIALRVGTATTGASKPSPPSSSSLPRLASEIPTCCASECWRKFARRGRRTRRDCGIPQPVTRGRFRTVPKFRERFCLPTFATRRTDRRGAGVVTEAKSIAARLTKGARIVHDKLPRKGQWVGAAHMVLSFASFRALLRYVSRTDTSCDSPQCGQSSFSILFHAARRLSASVPIPVAVCRPVLGQVKYSSFTNGLFSSDLEPRSARAWHVKQRTLPPRRWYKGCASRRTAFALIPWAMTTPQLSQMSEILIKPDIPACPPQPTKTNVRDLKLR
jgi:hypothetical protein